MDQYFRYRNYVINEGEVSGTVKFLLRDLIELRMNNWVPRRQEEDPRTIQIHQEVALQVTELISVQKKGRQESNETVDEVNLRRRSASPHLHDDNEFTPEISNVQGKRQLGRSGLLNTFLTDQQKQLEALDTYRNE